MCPQEDCFAWSSQTRQKGSGEASASFWSRSWPSQWIWAHTSCTGCTSWTHRNHGTLIAKRWDLIIQDVMGNEGSGQRNLASVINIWGEVVKKTNPASSLWCPLRTGGNGQLKPRKCLEILKAKHGPGQSGVADTAWAQDWTGQSPEVFSNLSWSVDLF